MIHEWIKKKFAFLKSMRLRFPRVTRTKAAMTICASLIMVISLTILAVSCGENNPQPIPSIENTPEPTTPPTPTRKPATPAVTVTPTPTKPPPNDADQEEKSLQVLAMADGYYRHLFVYHPLYLPMTRLTTGNYNYDHPSISPDGEKIAYCADQHGKWDIYILNLLDGEERRITENGTFHCSPDWSPDGRWLVYHQLDGDVLNLVIQSITDEDEITPLTSNGANNFDPAWSPGGREIAFVSDVSGIRQIWIANLDTPQERFHLAAEDASDQKNSPAWSPDGQNLTWAVSDGETHLQNKVNVTNHADIFDMGAGVNPVWLPDGSGVAALLSSANSMELITFESGSDQLLLPPIHLPQEVSSFDWGNGDFTQNVTQFLVEQTPVEVKALWQPHIKPTSEETGLLEFVDIKNLKAPRASLSDLVDESFNALRSDLNREVGWDFFGILENALIPIDATTQSPGQEDWLQTGRAVALNLDPLDAGWMTVTREEIGGRVYWRLWIKCMQQDGTCGTPLMQPVWDFSSRLEGDQTAYDNGGSYVSPPKGFWLDLTSFALRYGWERLPAAPNWLGYFPAAHVNLLVMRESLTWKDAMLQVYPAEMIELIVK